MLYPQIDPVALQLGPLAIHWYGLMYLIGFLAAWLLGRWRAQQPDSHWTRQQVDDLIFYTALGVFLGGRLGYVLFYQTHLLWTDPLALFKVWQGGMSFHGGLLGVLAALALLAHKTNKSFFNVTDFVAPLVPLGLLFGRLGNFINGELWGRPSHVPWAMIFPHVDQQTRHPSQLYQAGLEGLALFVVLWWFSSRSRPEKAVSAVFAMGYGIMRCIGELFRQPDAHLGFLAAGLTMGQLLSLPLVLFGVWLWRQAYPKGYRHHSL